MSCMSCDLRTLVFLGTKSGDSLKTLTCVACACPASHSLGSTAKHSESDQRHLGEGAVKTRPHLWP